MALATEQDACRKVRAAIISRFNIPVLRVTSAGVLSTISH